MDLRKLTETTTSAALARRWSKKKVHPSQFPRLFIYDEVSFRILAEDPGAFQRRARRARGRARGSAAGVRRGSGGLTRPPPAAAADVTDVDLDSISEAEHLWRSPRHAGGEVDVRAATQRAWVDRFGAGMAKGQKLAGRLAMPEALVRATGRPRKEPARRKSLGAHDRSPDKSGSGASASPSKRARVEVHGELVNDDEEEEEDEEDEEDGVLVLEDEDGDGGAPTDAGATPTPVSGLEYEKYKLLERQLQVQDERLEQLAQKVCRSNGKMGQQILDLTEQVRALVQSQPAGQHRSQPAVGADGLTGGGAAARPDGGPPQAALDDVLARISGLHGAMRSELEATRKKAEDLEAQLQPHIDFHRRLMQMNAGLLASQGAQAPGDASGARSA